MNVVFLSPHFPPNWYHFVVPLHRLTSSVRELRDALSASTRRTRNRGRTSARAGGPRAASGAPGTYSPITAQSRPIMMKKPENIAISASPP
jgi:hypothetical protein